MAALVLVSVAYMIDKYVAAVVSHSLNHDRD